MIRTVLIAIFSFLLTAASAQTTRVTQSGATISGPAYTPVDWYKVSVPTTVIAGLLANNVYNFDPFMGMNFEKLKDPILDAPWWFRKEFTLPASDKGRD